MPSLINDFALKEIKELVDANPSLIVVDPTGLKSDESLALRKSLSDVGARMKVSKARLIQRAVPEDAAEHLKVAGSLAVIVGEDIAAAAKIVRDLAKEEKLAVRGGVVEGSALDSSGALRLADLPSRHEAQIMVVKAIRAPAVKLAKVLKAPYRKLGRAVMARKEKLEE